MGDYRIEIDAVGGHGCQRHVKHGGTVEPRCEYPDQCPDCAAREFVEKLKLSNSIKSAKLTHWPNALDWNGKSVVDDLVTRQRKGEF